MQIPKPSGAGKDYFRSNVPDHPAVEVRPMFGNLGVFVKGNMFTGLFGPIIGVRVEGTDHQALDAFDGTGPLVITSSRTRPGHATQRAVPKTF